MQYDEMKHWIKEKYQLDISADVLFKHDHHIQFCFDWQEMPRMVHILSGDLSIIGLPSQNVLPFKWIIPKIQTINELSEVEGKEIFLNNLIRRIDYMEDDLGLYLPLKIQESTLWLTVMMEKITQENNRPKLVYGKIVRVSTSTPVEIIHYQKTYQDSLTRLFTRETLRNHLRTLIPHDDTYAMYVDLDGFKRINDFFGHRYGDAFLVDVSNRFIEKWESDVIYYRLGGDEFFVIVYHHSEEAIIKRANDLIRLIESIEVEGKTGGVSASVGIVRVTEENKRYETLLDIADQTMYMAKHSGKGKAVLLKEV
ncbi:MAG: GGDEF domain-containing protein [Candidatus Izemoplasmatales bacterium]|nr:GGDEF domain-containing protein [bacterium]MDZ4196759.1 GGDEF domain-containing protein [Candidatus Izemoplasmatales bacterium]